MDERLAETMCVTVYALVSMVTLRIKFSKRRTTKGTDQSLKRTSATEISNT